MNRTGFTLIELLVVVVIIGILAAVGVPKFASSKQKAYITAMKSDLRNLLNAQEAYFADSARYSSSVTSLNFRPTSGVTSPVIAVYAGAWTATNGHTQMVAVQCAIAANTSNPLAGAAGEGEVVCR